jgi:hypothetical protein
VKHVGSVSVTQRQEVGNGTVRNNKFLTTRLFLDDLTPAEALPPFRPLLRHRGCKAAG